MALSVFISSTSRDLQAHRAAVKAAIERLELRPIDMLNFGSQPGDAVDVSLDQVRQADLFVGIIAHRYGYVPEGMTTSVTEQEYDEAIKRGIPRLMYLVDPAHEWPDEFLEQDELAQERLAAFKRRIETESVRSLFTTPENLAQQVTADLARLVAVRRQRRLGWAIVGVVLAAVLMLGLVLVADKGMRSSLIEIAGLASQTPTATLTATFTPTPTPTLTPTPSPTPIPTLASYEIGLAVAYFAIPDDGSVSVEEADTLVDQINARLASELASFSDTVGLTLGYLGPADVGRIQGTDGGEREADANIIAERHDADVVLYGAITSGAGGLLEVQPEFYVSPDTFTDALEMAGAHRLGRAISVSGPLEAIRNALKINRPLSARTTAMVHIFAGLTYYAVEDFEDALGEFEAAADDPDWGPAEGREVLHVLLGNAQLKLASVAAQTNNVAQAREKLPLAEAEYRAAADLAPDYARAYTGLAAAAYLTWNVGLIDSGVSDIEPLEQALDYLELAHDARDQPRDTAVETRPVFARLQVDYALWYYHTELPPDRLAAIYQDFEDTAAQILEIYGDGRVRALQPIASETYALLGLVSYANYQCADAIGQYQQALDLSQSPRRRMFFYVWQAECYVEQGQNSRAAANYAEAIAIARALGDVPEEQVNRYETRLAELRGS